MAAVGQAPASTLRAASKRNRTRSAQLVALTQPRKSAASRRSSAPC